MLDAVNESDIIERLNNASSVRGYFIVAEEVLSEAVEALMQRIFLKDDFAVQSVVGPLLHDTGPLGNTLVRLKLLYGLGAIGDDEYHDIERIIKIRHKLSADIVEYAFTDENIVQTIRGISAIKKMGAVQFDIVQSDGEDPEFYQLQLQRQQRVIKSSLALAIVELCHSLNKESPFW